MSTNASRPELKWRRGDAVVAALVALLAIGVALWFYLPGIGGSDALTVVISVGGQETERVALRDFSQTTVTHNGCTLQITAGDGGVQVADSDCPGQDCVHTGTIHRAGQSIVCLPAQVVIHLEGHSAVPDTPDVIVG